MNLKEEMGRRLRDKRNSKGMSLKALSDASGGLYSASRLGNYEQGTRELPVKCAQTMAVTLNCSASYLLCIIDKDLTREQEELFKAILEAPEALQDGALRLLGVAKPPES